MAADAPSLVASAFVYLSAAVVSVPIAKRLGLGSVLGYLIAGAIIGPFGLKLVGDPEGVMHAAEFGVVIMLFLIGLELQPSLLWRLRTAILGMGGAQVLLSGAALMGVGVALGLSWQMALAAGLTLALSSTAIVLSSLREKGQAGTAAGRASFAVLLFQDIAIIPMLALFPLLATLPANGAAASGGALAALPAWAQALAVVAAVGGIVLAGRLLLRPLFRWVAQTGLHEIFTASALMLVAGVALLMQTVGLSPALGAFVAGVVLADSEFRHEIETDIEPFRGLLLGLFFISVGASVDFDLVVSEPLLILALVAGLIAIKALVLFLVARAFKERVGDAAMTALSLAQGGEFAFVLFAFAQAAGVLSGEVARPLVVAVALSMAVTPLLMNLGEKIARASEREAAGEARAPEIEEGRPDVIVAGYGRFGQVVGRLLAAQGLAISVLEHDTEQVDVLRGFGRKVNYGDASRIDLLRVAGAADARLLVIAIDDQEKAVELVRTAREHFPRLKIAARAFDRRHAYQLMGEKVDAWERETFAAGVALGVKALRLLGRPAYKAERAGKVFAKFDERLLAEMHAHWAAQDFPTYQRMVRDRTALEEDLLRRESARAGVTLSDDAWDVEALQAETADRSGGA
jgi:glutathione-regulated potassium-efflux system ancillary protein KefC/glutathione-regulated potassium-efflux system protein KefB